MPIALINEFYEPVKSQYKPDFKMLNRNVSRLQTMENIIVEDMNLLNIMQS